MTNLAHWQDDIEDALGGDFDGSLSGLCIMSLSFDFTRNVAGSHMGAINKDANSLGNNLQANGHTSASSMVVKSHCGANNDTSNENSVNCFKRFKSYVDHDNLFESETKSSSQQSKTPRQNIKSCSSGILSAPGSSSTNYSQEESRNDQSSNAVVEDSDPNGLSPQSSAEDSCHRASALSTSDESSRSSAGDVRSPSPSHSSSITSHSQASSRSQSPSDMSVHGGVNKNSNNHLNSRLNLYADQNSNRNSDPKASGAQDNQQAPLYPMKDSLFNGATLKESSYTTSVITTTAPMHFKNMHHPFSLKQFPPSPYHQFSNSSLNHDFYDRYMSLDSHQPLQTPLIGIERTQDLLSLKLPPHGPDETDSQRFPKDWPFEEAKQENVPHSSNETSDKRDLQTINCTNKGKDNSDDNHAQEKGFPFNYKSTSNSSDARAKNQREPIDLNMSFNNQEACCDDEEKGDIFNESMKHFNPERIRQGASFDSRSKGNSTTEVENHGNDPGNVSNVAHQCHGQESMFGVDPSKQKFQYVLAAPISVATKLNEDTMTYLNQAQAYEIKLENTTDLAEAKKGFMCSIINIGFQERHMQQAENELWQQWSHQHPNEKIFSVDMKLSYNVFGVESDGLNKYEFLWDSSKAAGVFIRINSISTEFTAKKHGGEKGVPFKLSIETFSYNSKTHDSYFISAACCQIKVFKPKGAERKIRSDRDKIFKRPLIEQEKYHKSCDHTIFKECPLASLHPMADGSLCYYRHSHGHFASKQVTSAASAGTSSSATSAHQQSNDELDQCNSSQTGRSSDGQPSDHHRNIKASHDSESSSNDQNNSHRDYSSQNARATSVLPRNQGDANTARASHSGHYGKHSFESSDHSDVNFAHHHNIHSESPYNHSTDIPFSQMYHGNPIRAIPGLTGISNTQHFGMQYYGHSLPPPISSHISTPNYGIANSGSIPSMAHSSQFPVAQQHLAVKGVSSIYRQLSHDKSAQSNQTSSVTNSFKASNLAISSTHSNFQSYLGNNGHMENCQENPNHEAKESTINNTAYHQEPYESLISHQYDSPAATSHSSSRQRSTSATLVTSNFSSYGTSNRHNDGHSRHNSMAVDPQSNQWYPPHNVGSQTPNCTLRMNHNPVNENQNYSTGSNYNCSNQHYDSDQASPYKIQNLNNDSSSSCYSSLKPNYHSNSFGQQQQESNESPRCQNQGSTITVNSDCHDVTAWFVANRFTLYSKTFNNFCGSDLLRLSKNDLIEICGLIDGIRLFNNLHNQPIKPKRVLYISCRDSDVFNPIYLFDVTLNELMRELSNIFRSQLSNNPHDEKRKKTNDKSMFSNSSNDSRSSSGQMSTEAIEDDLCGQQNHCLSIAGPHRRKSIVSEQKSPNCTYSLQGNTIDRLLIEGLTSVKVIATEQVVQMLENDSLWGLSIATDHSGHTEACISARRSKRIPK